MIRFHVGDLRISVLDAGSLWLDGGAMFGVVPRALWERERAPDERNRIRLAMNVLLVEDGKKHILVDTGAGDRWDDKARGIYRLDPRTPAEFLEPAGLHPGDIDLVINSHLHFDHAGGNTEGDGRGGVRAAFPNARYVVQAGELEAALHPHERNRASYRRDDVVPLVEEERWQTVSGSAWITSYLQLRHAPGHTPHLQVPVVVTPERSVAFLADLVPTSSHVPFPYIMAYDLDPMVTLATKKRMLPEAARERWVVVFEHDDEMRVGALEERDGRLRPRPVIEEI